jgi:hypothetical protein
VSSASLILTDGGLALSEPKAVGAQGSTKVLAASSLGSCLVFVSSAVVTVALAAIGRDMRLSPLDLQWVMNAELLPLAALTLVAGALGDRFGQKRIFLAGIGLCGLGATAIGFAPSFAPLIVGRFLQGLGEALILPNGLSVLGQAFPADKKARAVGIWSAAAAVASGVAPAIAGAILDHGSWRTTFLMLPDAPARSRRRVVRNARRGKILLCDQTDLPCPVLSAKRFPFPATPNHLYIPRHPVPLLRGVSRSSRTLERDAMDASCAADDGASCGRRRRVVLTPRRWCQVRGTLFRG